MYTMWPVYLMSLLIVCVAVPINRDFAINDRATYVDRSNEKFGNESVCVSDDVLYKEGDVIPTTNVCERCTCKPPRFVCHDVKCEVKPGCRAIQRPNTCCPEYQCECEREGKLYQNGERLDNVDSPCQACYCQSGEIVCTVIECYRRDDCEPHYVDGTCCPKYDHCPPLEPTPMTLYTSTSKLQEEADLQNSPEDNLQDNTVDSSKRINVLEEIMSDSPYLSPVSLQQYEDDLSMKLNSDDAELLEVNMSEVYTERTTVPKEDETSLHDNGSEGTSSSGHEDKSSASDTNQTSLEQNIQNNGYVERIKFVETLKANETIDHKDQIPNIQGTLPEEEHGSVEKEMLSSEETTTISAEQTTDPADTMLGDGQPSGYVGETQYVNSDESHKDTSLPASDENSEETSTKSKEDEVTTAIPKYKSEENSNESGSLEKSAEDESKEEIKSVISTSSEEYEIPVLTIKSDVSAENMSIVIPQPFESKAGHGEGSSLVDDDSHTNDSTENISSSDSNEDEEGSKEHTSHSQEVHITNKKVDKIDPQDSSQKDSSEEDDQSEMMHDDDPAVNNKLTETTTSATPNGSEQTEDSSETSTEIEDISTTHQVSQDNKINSETATTEIIETTESDEIHSTTQNALEGEHPENSSDSSELSETTSVYDVPSTTPNVLEGEHPKTSDDVPSTTPKFWENDHSEDRHDSSETSDPLSSDEIVSTTQNALEGEPLENRGSDSTEISDAISTDGVSLTTSSVWESEHSEDRHESSGTEDATRSDEMLSTTPNVLDGEHPQNRKPYSSEISDPASSDEILSTTPNVLEGEHPESNSESSEMTNDNSVTTTMPNLLEAEHSNNRLSDSVESSTQSDDTIFSTTLGDDPEVKENVSGDLSESVESTETEVSEKTETETDDTSESRETVTEYMTTTEESMALEMTNTNEEDGSLKILPPTVAINKTLTGVVISDKIEGLPEKWLKSEEVINRTKHEDKVLSKENAETESTSAETTSEIPETTSTLEYNEYSGSFYKSSEEHKVSDEGSTVISSSEVGVNSGEELTTTVTTSAETEIPTEELYQWGETEEKFDLNKHESHTLLNKEGIEIMPIYVASYGSSGSNEQMFSTAEIYGDYGSTEVNHKTNESNERETDLSTEVPAADTTSSSKEDTSTQTEEVYSNEYLDSRETTTILSNNTETTTNKNGTETSTPISLYDSNYLESDTSKRIYPSWEDFNSKNEETYESSNMN